MNDSRFVIWWNHQSNTYPGGPGIDGFVHTSRNRALIFASKLNRECRNTYGDKKGEYVTVIEYKAESRFPG